MANRFGNEKVYSSEDRRAALELAAVVGIKPAARKLEISATSIRRWIDADPQLWSDLRAGELEAHRAGFAGRLEDLADRYGEAEDKALDAVMDKLEHHAKDMDGKTLAALMKAMGSSRATATIGARATRGEPDSTVRLDINFTQLEQAMQAVLEQGNAGNGPLLDPSSSDRGELMPAVPGQAEEIT